MLFPLSPCTYKEVEWNKDSFQAAKTDSYVEGFTSGKAGVLMLRIRWFRIKILGFGGGMNYLNQNNMIRICSFGNFNYFSNNSLYSWRRMGSLLNGLRVRDGTSKVFTFTCFLCCPYSKSLRKIGRIDKDWYHAFWKKGNSFISCCMPSNESSIW